MIKGLIIGIAVAVGIGLIPLFTIPAFAEMNIENIMSNYKFKGE